MDGHSWLPLVKAAQTDQDTTAAANWRTEFMVEYSGGNDLPNGGGGMLGSGGTKVDSVELEVLAESRAFIASLHTTLANPGLGGAVNATAMCAANDDDELSITGKCSCTVGAITGDVHDKSPCDGKNNTYAVSVPSPCLDVTKSVSLHTERLAEHCFRYHCTDCTTKLICAVELYC
jgi:hypothetical protein